VLFDRFSFADNLALKHHNKREKLEGGEAYIRMQFCFKIDEPVISAAAYGRWQLMVEKSAVNRAIQNSS